MKLSFQYLKDEYARGFWMDAKRRLNLSVDLALIALSFIGAGWFFFEGDILWGSMALGPGVILSGMLLFARFIIPYFIYQKYIRKRGEYTLEFTEEGIHFQTSNIDSKINWAMYTQALIGPEHYLLYYGENQFTLVPRRAFTSAGQLEAFDALIRKHIEQIEFA